MNVRAPLLKPLGMPRGMDPQIWRQSVEKRLNDLLDRAMSLITALDLMEADFCDDEDTGDYESSLGWGERPGCHMECDDREQDNCDDEDSHDAEPSGDGEIIMWPDDMESQEVLVESGV